MNKNKIALTLGIVCIILTIAICVQINTIKNANSTVSKAFAKDELRDEVLKWNEKYERISNQLNEAEKRLAKIREESTKDDSNSTSKEEQIRLNNNLLGMTNLEGPGIEMVVEDDPNEIGPLDDIYYHIVHDADLRVLVNELKNAGAEAISINGQRIVNTTAITCIGNVIKVNNERITSPFTIRAIGFQESLMGIDWSAGYTKQLRQYGIIVNIKKLNKVEIPKYTGVISAQYMNIEK